MQEVVKELQNIQSDLVGIVLPVVITAIVTLLTVIVNAAAKIVTDNNKYKSEQYKIMQDFYPEYKLNLLKIKIAAQELEKNQLYVNLESAISKYVEMKKDEALYRSIHAEESQYIDAFKTSMERYLNAVTGMNTCMQNIKIPNISCFHSLKKRKILRMLSDMQYYSMLWERYSVGDVEPEVFLLEINSFGISAIKMSEEKIREYIDLSDKWIRLY